MDLMSIVIKIVLLVRQPHGCLCMHVTSCMTVSNMASHTCSHILVSQLKKGI
jgi:hypothetical protein